MERTVGWGDQQIVFTVKRSRRRRTVALSIDSSGAIRVHAPTYVWGPFIDRFVRAQSAWIRKKLAVFKERLAQHPPFQFIPGEIFKVWGSDVELQNIEPFRQAGVPADPAAVRGTLEAWYARQVEEKLPDAVSRYSKLLNVSPRSVRVADQRSRWGSCSAKGDLRFSWRLAMLPETILEYVVIHELAHLKQPDHSRRFWAVVESVCPSHKSLRQWLRDNRWTWAWA
jgi:predicted metal-dependent hydrolase